MLKTLRSRVVLACGLALAVGLAALTLSPTQSVAEAPAKKASSSGPKYTVVMTEAHNLLVTDNSANKLYFYTIDKDKPIGSPLKLRASVDLAKVGEDEIKITPHNIEKSEK